MLSDILLHVATGYITGIPEGVASYPGIPKSLGTRLPKMRVAKIAYGIGRHVLVVDQRYGFGRRQSTSRYEQLWKITSVCVQMLAMCNWNV